MLARLIEASDVSTSEGESITEAGDESLRQGVYLPLDERIKLTYRMALLTALIGSKVVGSGCLIRIQ